MVYEGSTTCIWYIPCTFARTGFLFLVDSNYPIMKESLPENWPKWVPQNINYPKIPLHQILDESAKKYPENIAIIFQDKKITYRELEKEVNSFATGLQKHGLAKNNRVAIYLPNIPQFIISYYGALKAGAIVTSICPLFKERELKHQLIDSGSDTLIILDLFYPLFEKIKSETFVKRIIVTSIKDYLPPLKRIIGVLLGKVQSYDVQGKGVLNFDELVDYPPEPIEVEFDPKKDLALLQYTGGTTGLPKGAMLTHYNLVSNAYMCNAWYGAEEGKDTYLNVIPFYHIFGMTATLNNAVATASSMILIPRFDIVEVLKSIEKYKATVFSGVTTLYTALLNHPDISREERNLILKRLYFSPNTSDENSHRILRISRNWPDARRANWQITQNTPTEDWWNGGTSNMLVIQGLDDKTAIPDNGKKLKENFPDRVTLVEIENAGHFVLLEKPKATLDAIISYLRNEVSC